MSVFFEMGIVFDNHDNLVELCELEEGEVLYNSDDDDDKSTKEKMNIKEELYLRKILLNTIKNNRR